MNNNTHAEEMDHPKEHQSNWINPLGLLRDISNIQDPHKKIELIMNVFKINYEGIKRNGKTIRNLIEELRPIYDILSETGKIDLN